MPSSMVMIGVAVREVREVAGELSGRKAAVLGLELIAVVLEELRARHVEPQIHIRPRPVAGLLDGLQMSLSAASFDSRFGAKAALIPHRGRQSRSASSFLRVWNTSTP